MAITATFSNGTLSIVGDDTQNAISVSRDLAGTILVNGGAVAITGGPATAANTALIDVSALGDLDTIQFDDTNGAFLPQRSRAETPPILSSAQARPTRSPAGAGTTPR
jgi:hypothetical protein